MYKITNLKLKNFVIFDSLDLNFDKISKLYIIQGEYVNNKNKSNGSGKTALIQSIIYGIFGISFRNIIKQGKQSASVYIKLEDENNKTIEILRTKKNNVSSLKLKINGELKSFTKKKDKQEYLNHLLLNSANSELYFETIFYSSYLSNLHFINLPPSKQINIIEKLLNFIILDSVYDKIRKKEQEYKYKINTYDSNINLLKNELKENKKKKISYVSNNILIEEKNEIDELKKELNNIEKNINELNERLKQIKITTNLTKEFLDVIKKEETCPVCHSNLNTDHIKELIIEFNQSNEYLNIKNEIIKLKNKKLNIESKIEFKILNIERMKKIKENEEIIEKDKINDIKLKIKQYKQEKDEIEKQFEMYNYLHSIFSTRSKVRVKIIQDYLKILSQQTLIYLKQFDSKINNFDIKIKDDKKYSSLDIIKDNINISNLSEGEKTKVQICLILSFIYMLFNIYRSNLGIIFFDEIFNTLDRDTLNITLQILKTFAEENQFQIFVITHNKIDINNFDRVIKVYRYDNYSEVENISIS